MAFFDNLTKKVSEASATAIQKGKEFTDIARLNSLVSDEEKKITNAYYQIGKLYVSIHRKDYEKDFAGMIETIVESEEKIVTLKKQIEDIKGVVRCDSCGAEVARGSVYCSSCGAEMPRVQTMGDPDSVKCESCGEYVKRGMRFCTNCGNPMSQNVNPREQHTDEDIIIQHPNEQNDDLLSPQSAVSVDINNKICPKCGSELDDGSVFCANCGAKI